MNGITKQQLNVLKAIRVLGQTIGRAPTQHEIAESLGLQPPTICEHIKHLHAKGMISDSRKLILTNDGKTALSPIMCPHCGKEITVRGGTEVSIGRQD